MNKAQNECTCPSGDGSLVHPCPTHPAVEQAGGDERAAFEAAFAAMGRPVCRADYDQDAYGTPFDDGGWTGWQARAALGQPSPTTDSRPAEWSSYDPTWVVDFIRNNSIFNADLIERMLEYATRPAGDVPQAEQAEAERPEVVARVVHSNPIVLGQCGPLNANDELMTVAQHAASVARWAEMFNRVEQQRDAAQAEVAGLRSLLNSLLCYVERDIDRMRSGRDKSDNKEIYDRSISLAMERLKAAQNAVFTTEPGCDTAVELAAQTTQALREEVERGNRITVAMALDISAVGEALGIPGEEQEGGTGEFIDLIRELQKEVEALRARVVVVPERKLLNAGVPGLNRNSGWNACLDELARLNGLTVSESALETLRKAASGEVKHLNNGLCPDDIEGHEARDPDCPVCRALLDTESDNV